MSIGRVNTNPSPRDLKLFGLIWLVFFTVLGSIAWFKWGQPTAAKVIWSLAVAVPAVGWAVPKFMRVVYVGMSFAAWPIGVVVSTVLLAIIYYLVVTPIGLMTRAFGYDAMRRRAVGKGEASYWRERTSDGGRDAKRYFRQF